MQHDERSERSQDRSEPTRVADAARSIGTEVAVELASGGLRLGVGVAVAVVAVALVVLLGEGTGRWWPWLGLLVLAAGAFAARTRWRLARYRVALLFGVVGAGANIALGVTTPLAVGVAVVAALISIAALAWSLTEAFLTS